MRKKNTHWQSTLHFSIWLFSCVFVIFQLTCQKTAQTWSHNELFSAKRSATFAKRFKFWCQLLWELKSIAKSPHFLLTIQPRRNPRQRSNRQLTADSTNHNALQLQEMPRTSQENRKQISQTDSYSFHMVHGRDPDQQGLRGWRNLVQVNSVFQTRYRPTRYHIRKKFRVVDLLDALWLEQEVRHKRNFW